MHPQVAAFVERCARLAHEQGSSVCAHAPSASRLRQVIAALVASGGGGGGGMRGEGKGRTEAGGKARKKKAKSINCPAGAGGGGKGEGERGEDAGGGGSDRMKEVLVRVATEFAMLHLGNRFHCASCRVLHLNRVCYASFG